ncbi:hypothetical protein GW7_02915 [Heterocephalus glaber]|uniref:Uncharacterized protein n=1 Tax=Heterocephalus glaber TaxID=10181 RepID=G5AT98_HETGA|nr:hypothetical protein GW7_02915 [Heterocephalus glaber]
MWELIIVLPLLPLAILRSYEDPDLFAAVLNDSVWETNQGVLSLVELQLGACSYNLHVLICKVKDKKHLQSKAPSGLLVWTPDVLLSDKIYGSGIRCKFTSPRTAGQPWKVITVSLAGQLLVNKKDVDTRAPSTGI